MRAPPASIVQFRSHLKHVLPPGIEPDVPEFDAQGRLRKLTHARQGGLNVDIVVTAGTGTYSATPVNA